MRSAVRMLWPFHDADPIGHYLDRERIPMAGVVADVRNSGGTAGDDPEYYLPRVHRAGHWIYGAQDESRHGAAIVLRDTIAALDASLPVAIATLGESAPRLAARPRSNAALFGLFAAIRLESAAFGLYGVLAFLVAQRTREIGVRMALRATPGTVPRLVLGNAARWLAIGAAGGAVLSLAVSRSLSKILLGVSGRDPAAWLGAAAALSAAAWLPARRRGLGGSHGGAAA